VEYKTTSQAAGFGLVVGRSRSASEPPRQLPPVDPLGRDAEPAWSKACRGQHPSVGHRRVDVASYEAGHPSEVAVVAAYLADPKARNVTGVSWPIATGGLSGS